MKRGLVCTIAVILLLSFMTGVTGCKKEDTPAKSSSKAGIATSSKAGGTSSKVSGTAKSTTKTSTAGSVVDTEDPDQGGAENESPNYGNDDKDYVPEEDEETVIDMGGRTIKKLWAYEVHLPVEGQVAYDIHKMIAEKYNFVWEHEVAGNNALMTQMLKMNSLAGTETHDVLTVSQSHIYPWAPKAEFLAVLDPYFEKLPERLQKFNLESTKWFGVQYGVGADLNKGTYTAMWYNRNVFERDGLVDPQILYDQDRWNWDEFLKILINGTRDFNGDGITDQYGISVPSVAWFYPMLVYGNGGQFVVNNDDGTASFNVYDRKVINAMQFCADLFSIHQVAHTSSNIFLTQAFAMAAVPLVQGNMYLKDRVNYGFVFPPKGPDTDKYKMAYKYFQNMYAIPSTARDIDKLVYILCDMANAAFSPEFNPDLLLPKVEQNYKMISTLWLWQDMKDAEHITKVMDMEEAGTATVINDDYYTYGLTNLLTDLFQNQIVMQRVPVSTALESARTAGQSIIDSFLSVE